MLKRPLFALTVAAPLLLAASAASASPTFPAAVQSHLSLTYTPACAICHTNGVTGTGTVNTPFGKSMRNRGLAAGNDGSVGTALDKLEADNVDSDGDTVLDIDELVMGTNVNVKDKGAAPSAGGPELAYGCGAQIAPRAVDPTAGLAALAAAVALGAAFARRRRR